MAEAGPGTSDRSAAKGHREQFFPSGFLRLAVSGLDLLIAVYVVALALIALTGGVDLGVVSVTGAAKPLLVLVLLVPLRMAIGGRSWLADPTRTTLGHVTHRWRLLSARVPAAVTDSAFAMLVVLAVSLAAGFLANLVLEPATPRGFTLPFTNARFVEVFAAWDSGWYWDIAARGYYFRPDGQSSVAFFPLYPMLMRALAAPFGGGDGATWIAGIVISLTACALALIAIHQITERIFESRDVARRTVLYVVVFPWSLFLTRVYAESLFLLTSVLAISRAWDGRWWRAGLWGALTTLVRPNGILIGILLALLALRDRPGVRELASRWIVLAPIPAAMMAYSVYVYTLSGDPLGWMSAQAQWGYSLGHPPWQQLIRTLTGLVELGPYHYFLSSDLAPFELLHGTAALIFLAMTPFVFRRLGIAMGTYVLVSLLVPLSGNALEGIGRYAAVIFPVFMVVASMASQRVHQAIIMVSLVFHTLFVCFFVTLQKIY